MGIRCEVCGKNVYEGKAIARRLNGKEHYCCCISCEVRWEKENLLGVCG